MAGSIKNLRPESAKRMMSEISNRQTFMWVGVAAVFHLILIVATSWGFIRAHFIDHTSTEAATVQAPADAQAQTQTPAPAAPAPDATAANAAAKPAAPAIPDSKPPTDVKPTAAAPAPDAPAPKPATPAAKTGDGKSPSHEGFNLDDSSLK